MKNVLISIAVILLLIVTAPIWLTVALAFLGYIIGIFVIAACAVGLITWLGK